MLVLIAEAVVQRRFATVGVHLVFRGSSLAKKTLYLTEKADFLINNVRLTPTNNHPTS